MGKMFEALKKAEKQRSRMLKQAGQDPAVLATGDGEIDTHLVAYFDRMSPISEEYRSLRTNLRAADASSPPKTIAVTSAVPGEGKTVTALNLAVTCADDPEARVVVVDADLRQPAVHRYFCVDNQRGLSDYLSGNVMLEIVLQRSRLPNLWILPAGRIPGGPSELLSGKKMDDLVSRLSRDFSLVIFDTPAIVARTDAAIVAPKTDGALLCVRIGSTPREMVGKALDLLYKARSKVIGTVITHASSAMPDYTLYPYGN